MTFQQSRRKTANVTDRVEIKCSHDDENLYMMLWYQQRQNGPLSLMGHSDHVNSPNYEEQFVDQITIVRENRVSGALIIHSVSLSHSAVYFCAGRPQ